MKTYQLNILVDKEEHNVLELLDQLVDKNIIQVQKVGRTMVAANEQQIEEIIEESELGPYYSDKEARAILNL
ncbi:hypothetical protein CLV98_108144 [Dyadobacter jejuensis]|uniref:Uncharacterized protein n=1 Tax=Dyadobacter jejuensis TaxID=1082580 RepID=A0A316AJR7_9BACT|nr:hypothetical protein [Dyadobacter jejuensis]PWJ57224.1 hypothetical protein CLV98_108144 [Dyadobacter jejuensis]